MKKKRQFEDLKQGAKFRYVRRLYLKDDCNTALHLVTGVPNYDIKSDTLVTPVKVGFMVK